MEAVLFDNYKATFVVTFENAKTLIDKRAFDLILCNAHFSESHSLELLQYVRKSRLNSGTPFLLVRALETPFRAAVNKSIDLAAHELGADQYIDFATLVRKMQAKDMIAYVQQAIETLLERSGEDKASGQKGISSDWDHISDPSDTA